MRNLFFILFVNSIIAHVLAPQSNDECSMSVARILHQACHFRVVEGLLNHQRYINFQIRSDFLNISMTEEEIRK